MEENMMRTRLRKGEVLIGTLIDFKDPNIVEIIGLAGFDFVFIDMEHSAREYENLENIIRAAELVSATPLVRIPEINESYALRALEAGAMGLIFPHVRTKEDAIRCVRATKYPPRGVRGMHPSTRASRFGSSSFAQHVREANEQTQVWVIIEDVEGVKNIEEIVRVEGLDVIMPGPGDLSVDLEVPGEWTHPTVIEHLDHVVSATRKVPGLNLAPFIAEPPQGKFWVDKGCNILIFQHDSILFSSIYKTLFRQIKDSLK